ncbi:hypothetical protein [Nocardia suismassiliense]|uniref:hypothetical protein n=1 Tax=Nocardia suismassiliense TaxID=2077092 RepID=UPI00131F3428|nr:hypothetical protein [Nocardia suismassiliense]
MHPTPTPLTEEAAFEIARGILTELIAYTGSRTDSQQWAARRQEWTLRLTALQVTDTAAVQAILQHDGAELAAISAG